MDRIAARWIDLGQCEPLAFHATYAGLAHAQGDDAAPIVVWGRAGAHLCLGQSQGLCELAEQVDVPVVCRPLGGGTVWVDEQQHSYAFVVPLALAPRRHEDWYGWSLQPAIDTMARVGLEATRYGEDLWVRGRKIAGSGSGTLGRCAVVASSFLLRFPHERFAASVAAPHAAYRRALIEGLARAMTDWASEADLPEPAALEQAFRTALAARLGWHLENDLVRPHEAESIAGWRTELAEPPEFGTRRRVPDGIKLNAELTLRAQPGTGAVELLRLPATPES